MVNKYCYECGNAMYGNKPCNNCGTRAIEMPISQGDLKTIEQIKAIQNANKPKKGTGCIVMVVAAFVMFGIPGIFMYLGDSILSYVIVSALLLLINVKLFTYRRGMTLKAKDSYFTLSKRTQQLVGDFEQLCPRCRQLLLGDMTHCPNCGRHAAEDIPIRLNLDKVDTGLEV